jgi:methionyl-tRNA synthetase
VHKYRAGRVSETSSGPFAEAVGRLPASIDDALADADFRTATAAIGAAVEEGNRLIETVRPWELFRAEQSGDAAAATRLDGLLAELVAGCRELAREIGPFVPAFAARLGIQLGAGDRVGPPEPAFPRLELPAAEPILSR